MKALLKSKKGITLIALVITIIVLLLLAGVSISMLTGENGILTQAKRAKEEMAKKSSEEQIKLSQLESYINNYLYGNSIPVDAMETLGIKGLYMICIEQTSEKYSETLDCIREWDGKIFREKIKITSNLGSEPSLEVISSKEVNSIENIAEAFYYVFTGQLDKVEMDDSTGIVIYKNKKYELKEEFENDTLKIYLEAEKPTYIEGNWIKVDLINDYTAILENENGEIYSMTPETNGQSLKEIKIEKIPELTGYSLENGVFISKDRKKVYEINEGKEYSIPQGINIKEVMGYQGYNQIAILTENGEVYGCSIEENQKIAENIDYMYSEKVWKDKNGNIIIYQKGIPINISEKFQGQVEQPLEVKNVFENRIITQAGEIIDVDSVEVKNLDVKVKDISYDFLISKEGDLYNYNKDYNTGNIITTKMDLGNVKFDKILSNYTVLDSYGNLWTNWIVEGQQFEKIIEPQEKLKDVITTNEGLIGITEDNRLYMEGKFSYAI